MAELCADTCKSAGVDITRCRTCTDASDAFSSISACTFGAACANGLAAGVPAFGSVACTCQATVAQFTVAASAAGCPLPFTTTVANGAPLSELCPETCMSAGAHVASCTTTSSPLPPALPSPISPPPLPSPISPPPAPPNVPGPSGFATVATVAQL
eukprot:3980617-Prymnesium_polylepis.1